MLLNPESYTTTLFSGLSVGHCLRLPTGPQCSLNEHGLPTDHWQAPLSHLMQSSSQLPEPSPGQREQCLGPVYQPPPSPLPDIQGNKTRSLWTDHRHCDTQYVCECNVSEESDVREQEGIFQPSWFHWFPMIVAIWEKNESWIWLKAAASFRTLENDYTHDLRKLQWLVKKQSILSRVD